MLLKTFIFKNVKYLWFYIIITNVYTIILIKITFIMRITYKLNSFDIYNVKIKCIHNYLL